MATKYEVYNTLIQAGIELGFQVLPEFRLIHTPDENKHRDLDIVWVLERAEPRIENPTILGNLVKYDIYAAFEIEGFDVSKVVGRTDIYRFEQHFENYQKIMDLQADVQHLKFALTILYEDAEDRGDWGVYTRPNTKQRRIDSRHDLFDDLKEPEYIDQPFEICAGEVLEEHLAFMIDEYLDDN